MSLYHCIRETTVGDQRDMDNGKVAHAVIQTGYESEELSTKIRSVTVYQNLEKEQCFLNVKQDSEGLCASLENQAHMFN